MRLISLANLTFLMLTTCGYCLAEEKAGDLAFNPGYAIVVLPEDVTEEDVKALVEEINKVSKIPCVIYQNTFDPVNLRVFAKSFSVAVSAESATKFYRAMLKKLKEK